MAKIETKASEEQMKGREHLYGLFNEIYKNEAISKHHLFHNLGLFLRNSALAKILFIAELYEAIHDKPGIICEFGVHLGQNLTLFENLRALHEPFNIQRRIVGFDTFTESGYSSRDDKKDGTAEEITGAGYQLPKKYPDLLKEILAYHQSNSVVPSHPRCELVIGDVMKTVPKFFDEHPGEVVALAYFDMATYKPTMSTLEVLRDRLVPGSVLLMDELNFRAYPGASTAFLDFAKKVGLKYSIRTSRFMRDRALVTFES